MCPGPTDVMYNEQPHHVHYMVMVEIVNSVPRV